MSHFVGLCFGENWDNDLEQYSENLEVEPYVDYTKEEAIRSVQRNQTKRYLEAIKKLQDSTLNSQNAIYYQNIVDKGPALSEADAWEEVLSWGYERDENDNLLSTFRSSGQCETLTGFSTALYGS